MIDDLRRLDALTAGWDPFSREEALWHGCPGHEWERFDFDVNRGHAPVRVERITRCGRCGAPRCDALRELNQDEIPRLAVIVRRARSGEISRAEVPSLRDVAAQFRRCTLERHHGSGHDFLELP